MNKSNQMTNSRVSGGDDKAGRMAGREVFMNRLSGWMGQLLGAFVLSLVMLNVAYAVNMPTSGTATWTLSNGNVYDSGGPHGKYSNRNNASAIIYPGVAGQIVRVSGALQIEPGWDYIRIYDGAGTNNPILFESSSDKPGRWDPSCQSFSIPVITSTSGPLTIQFTSDNSVTCAGFNLAVSNVSPPMNAVFVSQSVPTTMTVGESYTVSVTMQNAGIEWSQVEAFKLGAQNPHDNSNWGFNRVELPAGTTVAMGQEHTFTFTVTAPLTEGNYNFQWRMLRENVDWFGETTPNVVVNVSAPPAPTTPSDTPLFLTNSAHPNIMWTLDDSSSMDWEFLAEESPAEKLPRIGLGNDLAAWLFYPGSNHSYNNAYVGTTSGSFYLRTAPSPRTSGFSDTWRYRTHHYNKLYYNPEITYRPWAGVDANGAPLYTNANPSAAIRYPDSHWYTGGQTLNLTTDFSFSTPTTGSWNVSQTIFPAKYYAWNDPRGDGEVRADDTHVMVKINDPNAAYDGGVNREDCVAHTDAPYKCTYEEEIQNFANWFQYHRSRSLVAKGAVGKLVSETTGTRMGWYSMRLRSSGPRYAVQTMDQTTRAALLSSLYSHTIGQQAFGTPSRTTMQYVGNYFKGNDSPILPYGQGGECQLNFNLLLTDGYWSSDDSVYVYDTDNDGVNNTLADVAYYYFRDPLKTFAENKVPPVTNPITNATITHPHLITYGISFGAPGVLDPWKFNPTSLNCWINTGGTSCWHDAADAQSHNIDPTDVADAKIDDLWHAAWNTTGQYISAMSPDELASALKSSLAHIIDRAGSAAAVSFNASTLSEDTALFLAQFNTNGWSGKLFKYPLDASDGTVQSTADWEAGHELTQRTSDRVILTRNPLITNDTGGVAFRWENLSNQQKDDFRTNPDGTQSNDVMAIARLNYVRGDRTNEGSGYQFRPRTSRLGDIIHSNPVYVGEPQMRWPSESPFPTGVNSFATWKKSSVKDREPVVYVGANDGMMHGFRASDGEEVLAYVPSHLYSSQAGEGLHFLTDTAYTHRFYVDGPMKVSDAYIKTDPNGSAAWHTVLIGGMRGGGKGVFALDVTDPDDFSEANADQIVLWEFNDENMGYTYGEATVGMLNNGKWAAILGNGYSAAGDGKAYLYILFLEGGIDGSWTINSDYIRIPTGVGSTANRNGLSTPAIIDLDGNGTVDRVYAGDLYGNLWAFDLSGSNSNQWDVAYTQGQTKNPLFSGSTSKPITHEPIVARHPTEQSDSGNAPNLMVYFGTGRYIYDSDKSNNVEQVIYGVWDHKESNITADTLQEQTLTEVTVNGQGRRVVSSNSVDWTTQDGWKVVLTSGERIVVKPVMRGNVVYFNSMKPSSDPCEHGGEGWLMALNMENGGAMSSGYGAFDLTNDGVIDQNDMVTVGDQQRVVAGIEFMFGIPAESAFLANFQYTPGTSTTDGSQIQKTQVEELPPLFPTGRLSWRELLEE